ncbi:uncharacterized protein GGS22DRAFT_193523 [Annulohypoxylon maeteangense]|uniref:uncharacterized protein n=1 Tax=Annulohypoxylon maeteangense TaxID=1927788 RepID=UPI0020075709|nr:uncharacterized protein GGS22DRAFT_193523 [Annulohypoxylon maeteangense]KAI0880176.1 hypothetical protein GGS22DRAFT_193523 [Annulohypoxylon maeteangense]
MDSSREAHQLDDLGPLGQQLWRPDLSQHFLQPGTVPSTNPPEFAYGIPLQEPHTGLNNLASAAAISDSYNMPQSQASPPSQSGPSAFITNEKLPTGTSTATAQQREQLKARRRVPNSQRKRTQVSCDACKTRRCKCVRLQSTPRAGNDATTHDYLPPCKLCVETGIPCVTSMPRKQRVYGSVENLDKRYRALEALVSGLFPDLNPRASADELVAFGQDRAIAMPDFSESSDQPRLSSVEPLTQPDTTKPSNQASQQWKRPDSNLIIAGTDGYKTILPPSYLMRSTPASSSAQPSPESATDSVVEHNAEKTELILDATGRPHYIGPCGSLAFFAEMREIFARQTNITKGLRETDASCNFPVSPRGALFNTNPLAASLGGTGDRGRASGSPSGRPGSGSPHHRVLDHLDGDSPPRICEDMLRDHFDDPEFWRYRKRVSTIQLPPRERTDICVRAFFHHVHPNFILFHRLTFQRAYEKMWRCWEAHRNSTQTDRIKEFSVSVGWLCCLYMIIILGSRALPQNGDSLEFQRKWFAQVDKLPPLLGTSSLPNVCAYMLLSLYFHNTNDRTSAWTFQGAACRLAIALGMHRESFSDLFEPVERQLRKRVWWTLYGYEQFLCCSLGRPSAIDDREMDVGIPDEEYLDTNLLPSHYVGHGAQLNMLLAAIRRGIFDPSFVPSKMYTRALEFLDTLAGWEDALPKGLRPAAFTTSLDGNSNQRRSSMLLHVQYHHALTFLTRPFLLETIQSACGGEPLGPDACKIRGLSNVCLTAAMRCGDLIVNIWRAGRINGVTWIDIFYTYMASLDISLALLSPDSLYQDEGHPEISKPRLIQRHTVGEMRNAVAQLCDVMTTIEVCGTNARFAKAAFEFASALGIIPVEKAFSLHLQVSDPKTMTMAQDPNERDHVQDQVFPGDPQQAMGVIGLGQHMTGLPNYPYILPDVNLNFTGEGFHDAPTDAMGNDLQWDMILPPSQWNGGALNMDLDWVWQCPNQRWHGSQAD